MTHGSLNSTKRGCSIEPEETHVHDGSGQFSYLPDSSIPIYAVCESTRYKCSRHGNVLFGVVLAGPVIAIYRCTCQGRASVRHSAQVEIKVAVAVAKCDV